jgi:type IV fimbrial biogenesis protein FimT
MDAFNPPRQIFRNARMRGFTLVELMVVIAMVAILATLATPSWTQLMARNAVRAAVNDLNASLQFARSEAVRLNSPITLCPSTDAISCVNTGFERGWIVRTGPQANAQPNDPPQQVLQDTLPRQRVRMGVSVAQSALTFLPNGLPSAGFAGVTIAVCPTDVGFGALTRTMVISRAGRMNLLQPGSCPP